MITAVINTRYERLAVRGRPHALPLSRGAETIVSRHPCHVNLCQSFRISASLALAVATDSQPANHGSIQFTTFYNVPPMQLCSNKPLLMLRSSKRKKVWCWIENKISRPKKQCKNPLVRYSQFPYLTLGCHITILVLEFPKNKRRYVSNKSCT